ncbi:major facilitator superfamily domain-containing protein [Xylaria scruposa]|nr:major facilitator superfamily domain-containing protein [Xylaria scruposa]
MDKRGRIPLSPYSTFSSRQKKGVVALVAFAGWFSSPSSSVYFPADPFIATDLGVFVEKINLTMTAYLIDGALCLYVAAANIGLALQSSFRMLFLLRIVQSAGISGSYAVTVGPIIIGLLMSRWSWRAIFWFLSAISPLCLVLVVLLLHETSRQVVGDGALLPSRENMALINALIPKQKRNESLSSSPNAKRFYFPNPLKPLALMRRPDTAINYSWLASLSNLFTRIYRVSGLVSGLTSIPFGVACAISALSMGKILDVDYRRTTARYGLNAEKGKNHDINIFPIEEARLQSLGYSPFVCGLLVAGYGWLLQYHVNIAAPLVFQFFIGLSIQGVFTALSTLLVDAASNLVRAELAAGGLALLDLILRRIGAGWTFVLLAVIGLLSVPRLYVLQLEGLKWRQKK